MQAGIKGVSRIWISYYVNFLSFSLKKEYPLA